MNAQFPSLPNPPDLSDVFTMFPHGAKPLLEFHDIILRGESPLSPNERELIAAHVSGLNACTYCFAAHSTIAEAFGVDPGIFEKMQTDLDAADVSEKLKPILAYVSKCSLFNFMNRLVEGTGCSPEAEAAGEDSDEPLESYVSWGREVGFID